MKRVRNLHEPPSGVKERMQAAPGLRGPTPATSKNAGRFRTRGNPTLTLWSTYSAPFQSRLQLQLSLQSFLFLNSNVTEEIKMHVLLATPTVGGIVKTSYANTLFRAAVAITSNGGRAEFVAVDGSDVAAARNFFANLLLRRPDITHLLMIDSDMSFDGDAILRLLHSNKPVIGAVYARRHMDLQAFGRAARNSEFAPADLAALVLEYDVQLKAGVLKVVDGMCRVERLALGCAAIRRDVFEDLVAAGVVQLRPDSALQGLGLERPFYDFFGQITCQNGDRLSEHYSFCKRWRSVPESEIWALVDAPVGRIGDIAYGADAPLLNRLRLLKLSKSFTEEVGARPESG